MTGLIQNYLFLIFRQLKLCQKIFQNTPVPNKRFTGVEWAVEY